MFNYNHSSTGIIFTGIEPHGNMVKQPAKFTVDTISAGQGDVMVFIEDPEGNREEVCLSRSLGNGRGLLLFYLGLIDLHLRRLALFADCSVSSGKLMA